MLNTAMEIIGKIMKNKIFPKVSLLIVRLYRQIEQSDKAAGPDKLKAKSWRHKLNELKGMRNMDGNNKTKYVIIGV